MAISRSLNSKQTDDAYVSKKIKKLLDEGYKQKQAVAIALQMSRDRKKKKKA